MVRVLIADDSRAFLDAAVDVVELTSGFELVGATSSGEAALDLAASTRPDLVLIDLRMPGIGGREAAERIRAARPETSIVFMTADSGQSLGAGAGYALIDKRTLSPASLSAVWEALERG